MSESESAVDHASNEIGILDYLILFARNKRVVFKITAVGAILSIVLSLIATPIYTAKVVIMPPQQDQSTAAMMLNQLGGMMGGLAGGIGSSLGLKNPNDLYIGMLKSKTVEDDLIRRFHLKELYKSDYLVSAETTLEKNTKIKSEKDGLISITFDDIDPKRAADVANAYVEELDNLTSGLAVTEASQKRMFFEKQLDLVRKNLIKAEFALQQTQQKLGGVIQLYPIEQEIATSSAMLRAQIAAKEVELSAMKIGVTPNNPDYLRLKQEIESLKAKLNGAEPLVSDDQKMDRKSLEYIENFRNVKYNQAVLEMLYKQYELAKIDEAKDYPMIQVLDKATPPEQRSSPRRKLIVIISTMLAFCLSLLYVFLREKMNEMLSDPRCFERLVLLKKLFFPGK